MLPQLGVKRILCPVLKCDESSCFRCIALYSSLFPLTSTRSQGFIAMRIKPFKVPLHVFIQPNSSVSTKWYKCFTASYTLWVQGGSADSPPRRRTLVRPSHAGLEPAVIARKFRLNTTAAGIAGWRETRKNAVCRYSPTIRSVSSSDIPGGKKTAAAVGQGSAEKQSSRHSFRYSADSAKSARDCKL